MLVEKNIVNNEIHDNPSGGNKRPAWRICTEETLREEAIKGRKVDWWSWESKANPGTNMGTWRRELLWSWGYLSLVVVSIWTSQLLEQRSS